MSNADKMFVRKSDYANNPEKPEDRYILPSIEDIDQYAHSVCWELAQRTKTKPDTEIERGFAGFVRVLVKIKLHSLERKQKEQKSIQGGSSVQEKAR